MAKILEGPLVSSITGRLGPVVFHRTRFGTVVQSVPKTVVHKSSAALATKDRFRQAQAVNAHIISSWRVAVANRANRDNTSPSGLLMTAIMSALNGNELPTIGNSAPSFDLTWSKFIDAWGDPAIRVSFTYEPGYNAPAPFPNTYQLPSGIRIPTYWIAPGEWGWYPPEGAPPFIIIFGNPGDMGSPPWPASPPPPQHGLKVIHFT